MKIYEENIRGLVKDAEEMEAKEAEKQQKQPVSTKLKDHTPMPPKPTQRPEKPTELIPQIDRMATPVLPSSVHLVAVKEKARDGSSTKYDKRIHFRGPYSAVARGRTNPNGNEEWTLFKSNSVSEERIATFRKVSTIEYGDNYQFFVCEDMNGMTGLYDCYGNKRLDHQFSAIEGIVFESPASVSNLIFKCLRNGKWGLCNPTWPDNIPCDYDDIRYEGLQDMFRVSKAGLYGIIDCTSKVKIPVEYAYIERINYKGCPDPYFIVSKDNIHYGIFIGTFKYGSEDLTLGDAREKVKQNASIFLKP